MDDDRLIDEYFAAMRRGAAAEQEMLDLFADDIVYDEPFTGIGEPAVGRDEVRARLRRGWEQPLPALELDVLSVHSSGPTATARWECRSPALPGPIRGTDTYTFADGKIVRLEVRLDSDADGDGAGGHNADGDGDGAGGHAADGDGDGAGSHGAGQGAGR